MGSPLSGFTRLCFFLVANRTSASVLHRFLAFLLNIILGASEWRHLLYIDNFFVIFSGRRHAVFRLIRILQRVFFAGLPHKEIHLNFVFSFAQSAITPPQLPHLFQLLLHPRCVRVPTKSCHGELNECFSTLTTIIISITFSNADHLLSIIELCVSPSIIFKILLIPLLFMDSPYFRVHPILFLAPQLTLCFYF